MFLIDGRDGPVSGGQHWSSEAALGNRAHLDLTTRPPGLVVQPVLASDHDQYRCRVDYRSHPTRNVRVQLRVVVPPRRLTVVSEAGLEVSGVIGPYPVDSSLTLHCRAENGRPPPLVTWWTKTTLLDDSSEERRGDVILNTLTLPTLTRADLYRVITCQAVNSKLSVPMAVSLTIDMTFPPISVKIAVPLDSLAEGQRYKMVCESSGSRPKADITWWKDGMLMTDATLQVYQEGNVSRSTLQLTPTLADHDTYISCRAENPLLTAQVIEDVLKLDVRYKPRLSLAAGQNLDMEDIKEGDDVYFECGIQANPRVYKVQWFHNRVSRDSTGEYTCSAANLEGSGDSNAVHLSVKFAPTCRPSQKVVYGAGKHEQLNVTCSVEAHPEPTTFRWAFNSSSEVMEIPGSKTWVLGDGVSQVSYTPRTHLDYGSLLCWATNDVSRQNQPCIYHIIHASPPDPVNNCTVENISSTSVGVRCQAGWDGGLTQTFTLSVSHARAHTRGHDTKKAPRVLANTSTSPRPEFNLAGLQAGTEYVLTILGVNKKGQSEPVRLAIFTLKDVAEKRTSPGVGMVNLTPIVGVVVGVVTSVVVTCVVIVVVVKSRRRRVSRPEVKMVYDKASSSPSQLRGQEEPPDSDDQNPDLIPVNHDQQMKDTTQEYSEEALTDTQPQEPDHLHHLQRHELQHHDMQLHELQQNDLQDDFKQNDLQSDLQHSDQQDDLQQHDVHQRDLQDDLQNNLQHRDPQGEIQQHDIHQYDLQQHDPMMKEPYGPYYMNPSRLLRQASLPTREGDPLLLLGRSLVASTPTGCIMQPTTYPHDLASSHALPTYPHDMSSTPTSPSYPHDMSSMQAPLTYPRDMSYTPTPPSFPRGQSLLPLSYAHHLSTTTLPKSYSRDMGSSSSYAQGLPSRSYAHHRLSLGRNDLLSLERVTPSFSSTRRGSASTVALNPDHESPLPIGPLASPLGRAEDINSSQRESSV
ncbi:Nephrin-like 7 [Homarus americanus]|uniref:Nephrin-like 7 n=1 Tax=Homarus americanus TaxID=6706 RepID=A0A8J5JM83_HOMAM|nr:Nephrin-like 7 [Homarus americanus]